MRWLLWVASTAALAVQHATANGYESAPWPGAQAALHFVGAVQGGDLSAVVAPRRHESYELQNGQTVDLKRWYQTSWVDVKLTWLSPVTPQWGVLWGFSTGERGPKYRIAPSLQLGALWVHPLERGGRLTFRLSQRWGGRLTERSCQANYGAIGGGLQEVNCRLATNEMPPADTLAFLYREKPADSRAVVSLRWDRPF